MGRLIGYARVSTRDQDYSGQERELAAAGCVEVFCEKESGKRTDRPQLARALEILGPGDVLVVSRLDRLARSTRDLLNMLDVIGKAGAGFRSLADAWADTTTPHGKLLLTILGGLAEFEHALIKARTGDGRKRAAERGVRFGRPPKLTPYQLGEVRRLLDGGSTYADVGRLLGIHATTVMRCARMAA